MTKRKRINITPERKEQIIKEILQNDSNIKLLATKYQITSRTLSKWRSDHYKAAKEKRLRSPEQQFVEVQVSKDINKSHLKKVELLLDNHSCSIEGRMILLAAELRGIYRKSINCFC